MMQKLVNDMLLYHGSYCEVQVPDLKKCAKYKDFGQGFYVTSSRSQAENFARISTRRALAHGMADVDKSYGMLSVFRFRFSEEVVVKTYPTADADWLRCIVGHRKIKTFPDIVQALKDIDIIGGKIANDDTNATITTYMAGGFGEVGTKPAEDICISLLKPERLQNQFCFKTNKALRCLAFIKSEQVE